MKKIFIIFLFIIFSSSFSLAKNNEKITVEEIENIFFGKKKILHYPRHNMNVLHIGESNAEKYQFIKLQIKNNLESYKKKVQTRGIAKCMYDFYKFMGNIMWGDTARERKCYAKVIRVTLSGSEYAKKRRPGSIFYALDALERFVYAWDIRKKFIKNFYYYESDTPVPGMVCGNPKVSRKKPGEKWFSCASFNKSTLKKLEKFKKDPSNEKILGKELINFIKNFRMLQDMREKTGTGNYALLGDMLNAVVADVKKNNISPDLKIRGVLLKKYSLILNGIEKKLDEDNYKSIDKDVSKLSKTYKDLKALTTNTNGVVNIDEAVNIIFDTNKLVEISALNSKNNEKEKLLALASINFMQSLIDSILSTIPEKYFVETKELSQDLFSESDLVELEVIIDTMMKKNKEIKSAELTKSMDTINKYSPKAINPSYVLKSLSNLGMKNNLNRTFTQNTATEIAKQHIRDNLDKEILKEAKKLLQEIDKNELSELAKEASDVAKEVSDVAKEVSDEVKDSESFSILDKKIGSTDFTLKQIIHASRTR